MKQLKCLLLSGGIAAFSFFGSTGHGATLIDNFDQYTNSSLIQGQNSAWRILGNASVDGLYSVANGVGGTRAASLVLDYKNGYTNGSTRHTFAVAQSFQTEIVFTLDIALSAIIPGTTVTAQISDSKGTNTIYEFTAAQSVANTGYQTYTFTMNASTTARVQGTARFDDVLADLKSVTFRFVNLTNQGKQTVYFDNLSYSTPIPEPSFALLSVFGGAAIWGASRLRALRRP